MDRYLVERAVMVRPASMSTTRQAMRWLSNWLVQRRPAVESLAELTRGDALDFLTWLYQQPKIKHADEPLHEATRRGIISAWRCSSAMVPTPSGRTCPPGQC